MSKFSNSRVARTSAAYLGSVLALLVGASGCSDDSQEIARKVGQVTESCALNSDCESPLICVFERCHEPCNADSDCTYPARCVQSDKTNVFACQFPEEAACSGGKNSECESPLVCAEDDQCRGPCGNDDDCPKQQTCTPDGVCAGKREVGDDGNLLTDAPTADADAATAPDDAPSDDDSDSDPALESGEDDDDSATDDDVDLPPSLDAGPAMPDNDEPTPSDESVDSGVAPEDNDEPPQDAGKEPTEQQDEDLDAGGESTFDYFEEEASAEPQPNDTREEAQPLTNASIWLEGSDEDWFYVDVPDDGRAQVIELAETQTSDLLSRVDIVAGADFSPIGTDYSTTAGTSRTTYATVGPGTRTLLRFYATNSAVGRAEISLRVTAEVDPYEPNPSRDEAAPIDLNTDVTAQMIEPYVSAVDRSADDYYLVELEEGAATIRLLSTPSNLRYTISLLPIGEGATQHIAYTTLGDTSSWEFEVPATGAYAVRFEDLEGVGAFFWVPAAHLSESYSFRVEQ